MVPTSGMSCLMTVLVIEKDAVGPNGRWQIINPSEHNTTLLLCDTYVTELAKVPTMAQ